ncbi:MAG: hypothetical protein ACXVBJ_10940 [Flavisolibacter sp.]
MKTPNVYNKKNRKARIQLKAGTRKGAITTTKQGFIQAVAERSADYIRLNTEILADANKKLAEK